MRKFKVAIFGAAASYHDMAAQKFYGEDVDSIESHTFRECCEKLNSNVVDYAIMAIENSVAGSILSNYNLVDEYKLRIIGEQYLKIELHLLALQGVKMEAIRFVHSHPMALAQCSNFLQNYPDIKIIEEGDTASCVKNISDKNLLNTAAISNEYASKLYNVPKLFSNIENIKHNFTRFMILSKGDLQPENPNKASISFRLKHKVGSLADVLKVFQECGVNLSKIQSVPVYDQTSQYSFHVDLEWDNYEDYINSLKKIENLTISIFILGEYVKAEIPNYKN